MIDHHDVVDAICPGDFSARARRLIGRQNFFAEQISVEHVVNERAFSRARDAGDACENAERKLHVDAAEIVFPCGFDADGAA